MSMRLSDPVFPLSVERFRLLRDHINKRFGIHFGDEDRFLVESRLSERLVQLDIDSFDFLNFLIALDERLRVEIPEADYGKLNTLDGMVRYLLAKLPK